MKKETIQTICIILLLLSFCFMGCGPVYEGDFHDMPQDVNILDSTMYKVVKIGECEYIQVDRGSSDYFRYSLTHKGDCKNPKHYFKDNNSYKYIVDLPEEYALISTNPSKPDTMAAYISRDTLYILFNNSVNK